MNKKMLFVFNPKAGKGKIKTNLLDIVDIFNKGGYEVIIYSTQKPKDAYEKAKEYESKVDLLCEWAYAYCYPTSEHRADELAPWMYHYNFHRPHSAVEHRPPATRLGFEGNNVLRNYS